MNATPEVPIGSAIQQPETTAGTVSIPQEQPQVPESYLEKLEKNNVQVRADDYTQPVISPQGQQLTTPIPTDVTTVTIPANQQQLLEWAKGEPNSSVTWLAKFWIRKIKQAVHHHWNLIMPPPTIQPVQSGQPIQQLQSNQPADDPQGQQAQPVQTSQVQDSQISNIQQPV